MDRQRAPFTSTIAAAPARQEHFRSAWLVKTGILLAAAALPACSQDEELDGAATRTQFERQGGDTTLVGQQSALIGTPPNRTRTIAAMMFDISQGPPTLATITNLISGPARSQRHMYQEISYGIQDLQTDYFGPFTLPVANCLTIACCGPSSDRTGNGATVTAEIAALSKTYDHYYWVYGRIPAGANCGTWGDEGRPNRIAVYSSYSFGSLVGYAQEIGHNFGMTHEPTITCAGAAPFLDDPTQCTHVEYGNQLSFMGGGEHHPSAYHKFAQGWISGCNVVKAGGSGTFTLVPQELPCNGVQLLQVPAPKTRVPPAAGDRQGNAPMLSNYYLEMRGQYGFDSNLTAPMVLVSIGGALPTAAAAAPYLYMLDLKPEAGRANHNNAGLMTVGQTYSDPAGGLTFTLMAIDNRSATVSVTSTGTGAATCADNTAFTLPGPDGTSCGPLAGGGADAGPPPGIGGATGAGGRAGTGGATGAGGRAGTGGATGTPGTGGSAAGSGGRSGTGGSATGTGGATGGGSVDAGAPGGLVNGGCGCVAAPGSPAGSLGLVLSLATLVGLVMRRRSRRGPH